MLETKQHFENNRMGCREKRENEETTKKWKTKERFVFMSTNFMVKLLFCNIHNRSVIVKLAGGVFFVLFSWIAYKIFLPLRKKVVQVERL